MGEAEVAEFISITGSSRAVALRLLDASAGDLGEAVEKFYADGNQETSGPSQPTSRRPTGPARNVAKIAGFGDLGRGDDDSDSDHNEYYVGGEKSGQLVKGAPKDESRSGDPIEGLFESARAAGAREGRPEDLHSGGNRQSGGFQAFQGTARTLAGGEADLPSRYQAADDDDKVLPITIAFYANGIFTVNDGEPRQMDDPVNQPFMHAIMRGVCPPELVPDDPATEIKINLVRKGEDYTPPAQPKYVAFKGAGHKLGGTTNTPNTTSSAAPSVQKTLVEGSWPGVDPSKPKTSIQLRLADGSRQVAEFNLDQTVADIRRFIRTARPDMSTTYTLATAFPQAVLTDDTATIKDAGLANSVVIQKL